MQPQALSGGAERRTSQTHGNKGVKTYYHAHLRSLGLTDPVPISGPMENKIFLQRLKHLRTTINDTGTTYQQTFCP
eukprot:GSA25T00010167001.1